MLKRVIFFIVFVQASLAFSAQQPAVSQLNRFSIGLMQAIDRQENLLIAPLSIASIMAFFYQGSEGDTKEQIASLIGKSALDNIEVLMDRLKQRVDNQAGCGLSFLCWLKRHLSRDPVSLSWNASLWHDERMILNPTFKSTVLKRFNLKIFSVGFKTRTQQSIDSINKWIERFTFGKIKNLVNAQIVSSSTQMVIANAIYS